MSPDWAAKPTDVPYAQFGDPQSLNLYGYVLESPTRKVDSDGHCCQAFSDFTSGWGGSLGSDVTGGITSRGTPDSAAGRAGAVAGDINAAVMGGLEILAGAGGEAGGIALDATGVGAVAGVPLNIASAGVAVHGVATAGAAIAAMGKLAKSPTGPGSVPKGQRATQRTASSAEKSQKLSEQGGKCANCEGPVKNGEGIGHHYPDRHADGSKDIVVVCKDCHTELHLSSK